MRKVFIVLISFVTAVLLFIVAYGFLVPVDKIAEEKNVSVISESHFEYASSTNDEFVSMENYINDSSKYSSLLGMVVIKDGKILYENYFNEANSDTRSQVHSVSKAITSMLVGIARDRGLLSENDKVLSFFNEMDIKNVDNRKENIEVEDLLKLTSGIKWNDAKDITMMNFYSRLGMDSLKFILNKPMIDKPGRKMIYNTGLGNIVDGIIYNVSKKHLLEFANEYLFYPLRIIEAECNVDNNGTCFGGEGFWLTPIEMAKLGQLMLDDGMVNSERILSKEWVELSTDPSVNTGWNGTEKDYGYGWFINSYKGYSSFEARGSYGQRIVVIKELNMVFSFASKTNKFGDGEEGIDEGIDYLINNYVIESIDD